MTENKYKTKRIIDGKPPRIVIVDDNGKVVNKNPSKDELKGLRNEPRRPHDTRRYTDEELLNYLIQFFEKYGRVPIARDLDNNPEYPNVGTYKRKFGSWSNALKLVGLDVDSMVKNGIIETSDQKSRLAEIKVIEHFKQHPIDLAGENKNSSCDGICPNGKMYDVKSSTLLSDEHGKYYCFSTRNKYKEEIEIYYFVALNDDYVIKYVWRVPGEIVESDMFYIRLKLTMHRIGSHNIDNMEEYNITDKFS